MNIWERIIYFIGLLEASSNPATAQAIYGMATR